MKFTRQLILSLVLICTTATSFTMQLSKLKLTDPPAWLHEVSKFYGTQKNTHDPKAFGKALYQSGVLNNKNLPKKIKDAYDAIENPHPTFPEKITLSLSTHPAGMLILQILVSYKMILKEQVLLASVALLGIPILTTIHHLYQEEQNYVTLGKAVIKTIKPD